MTKKTIFEFEVSNEESLHYQLTFLGLDLTGRQLKVIISERHTGVHKVDLSGSNVQLAGTGTVTVRYPKASMAGWNLIEYQADLFDVTSGTDLRIMACRFKYDEPGRLTHGVKGASATVQWGANEAVITAIGGVGPAGPVNVLTPGSIEVLDPDAEPEISITGEAPNQQLHIKMPRGQPGFADKIGAEQARDLAFAHRNAAELFKNNAAASASAALAQRNAAETAAGAAAASEQSAANAAAVVGSAQASAQEAATVAVAAQITASTKANEASESAELSLEKAGEAAASEAVALAKAGEAALDAASALAHKNAAQEAQSVAEDASTSASTSSGAALQFRIEAGDAKTAAEAARDLALGYRDSTLTAEQNTLGYRDATLAYRDQAEVFRDEAESFRTQAAASAAVAAQVDPDDYVQKTSGTGAALLPAGPTADRGAGAPGWMRYNSETQKFEGFSAAWGSLGGGFYIGVEPPDNPGHGDPWLHSGEGALYAYFKPEGALYGVWIEVSPGADPASFLKIGNDLSDLNNVPQALTNLGFGAFGKLLAAAVDAAAARASLGMLWKPLALYKPTVAENFKDFAIPADAKTIRIRGTYKGDVLSSLYMRVSFDGGITFRAGGSDYETGYIYQAGSAAPSGFSGSDTGQAILTVTSAAESVSYVPFDCSVTNGTPSHYAKWRSESLGFAASVGDSDCIYRGYCAVLGQVNAIRLLASAGNLLPGTEIALEYL